MKCFEKHRKKSKEKQCGQLRNDNKISTVMHPINAIHDRKSYICHEKELMLLFVILRPGMISNRMLNKQN